jgi:hypothetical protein
MLAAEGGNEFLKLGGGVLDVLSVALELQFPEVTRVDDVVEDGPSSIRHTGTTLTSSASRDQADASRPSQETQQSLWY